MRASVGRVVATRCETFPLGDYVYGLPGWQRYGVATTLATHLGPEVDAPAMLSVYGATGLTAYIGMIDIGKVEAGQTVVVSAAAGATGSLAAQIAKIRGCRVVGICGSAEKARWLVDELGLDGAIDHRVENVPARLKELCPDRIDVYFDNVGGRSSTPCSIAWPCTPGSCCAAPSPSTTSTAARRGRQLLPAHQPPGPDEGFLSLDYWDRFPEVAGTLGTWMAEEADVPHRGVRGARLGGRRPQCPFHRGEHRQDRDPSVTHVAGP